VLLGLAVSVAGGWIGLGPRYQFKTEGVYTTRGDLRTGEIVIYGLAEGGKAIRREVTKEADKNR
jgi:hypothetical protein